MRFKFLPEIATADIAFEAYGKNLEELFANAGMALMAVMVDIKDIKPSKNHELRIKNKGLEELLFDFLSELVFLKDKQQILFSKFEVKIKSLYSKPYALVANLWGEKINPKKHKLRADIKAVTWHLFKIEKTKSGYKARVVVDI